MAVTAAKARLTSPLEEIQSLLRDLGLGGWLLCDFRGNNPIACGVVGLPALSRRWFVLIPAAGDPVALVHRIEEQPWSEWAGQTSVYLSWQSLQDGLRKIATGHGELAVEYSPNDAIPYVDRVPAGVFEMLLGAGATLVSSADLVTALYARWSSEGEASHRRASEILRATVHEAYDWIAGRITLGEPVTEWRVRERILSALHSAGLSTGADVVVAVNAHAANPHFSPSPEADVPLRPGDVLLIDLWGKEGGEAVFADQTWMAFVGDSIPPQVNDAWVAVRDARDAAIELLRERSRADRPVAGFEVDDRARGLIASRGFGDLFIHRTGHSIDRELHGSGPNIDNLETRDERLLLPGIGFSIEPGVYLQGEFGIRSEVNVLMSSDGPEITTPQPQSEMFRIIAG